MPEKITVLLEIILTIGLITSYYYVSVNSKYKTVTKWLIALLSISILFLSDKIKALLFAITICGMFAIKYFTKKRENNGRAT